MALKSLKKIALSTLVGVSFFILGNGFYRGIKSALEYIDRVKKMSSQEVIKMITTPEQAEKYLLTYLTYKNDQDTFGEKDHIASFRVIHANEGDDCDGGALAAAALLSDNNYPSSLLCMYKKKHSLENLGGHGIFIYMQEGKWGTLGINALDCKNPSYSSIEQIVKSYGYDKFNIIDISKQYPDWLTNTKNMRSKIYRPDLAKLLE